MYTEGNCIFQRCIFENVLQLHPVLENNYSVLLDECNFSGQKAKLKVGTVMDAATFIIRGSLLRELQLRKAVCGGVIVFENHTKEYVVLHAKLDHESYQQRLAILVNVPAHTLLITDLLTDESDSDTEDDGDYLIDLIYDDLIIW